MRSKLLLASCFTMLPLGGCKVEEDLCAAYSCAAPAAVLRISFKDAATHEDLLFASSPRYQKSEITIKRQGGTENTAFTVDSTSSVGKTIVIWVSSSQELSVKIGDLPEDEIAIETRYISSGCCGTLEVASVKLNQSLVCSNCSTIPVIAISK